MNVSIIKLLFVVIIASLLTACASHDQDVQTSELLQSENTIFVGKIAKMEDGLDGSTIKLVNDRTKEVMHAVVSIPNLSMESEFDLADLKQGNILKVSGEPFQLKDKTQMAARTAMSYKPISFNESIATAQERADCLSVGGDIIKSGKAQWERCIQPLKDTNQVCSDRSQCFGDCLMRADFKGAERGDEVAGYCAATNQRFGCRDIVSNGRFEGTLCID